MTTKPSPGALRAAEIIVETINLEPTEPEHKEELRSLTVEILANTIDRETGASDLLAALKYVNQDFTTMMYLYNADEKFTKQQLYDKVRASAIALTNFLAVITKAEPPTQEKKGD